MSSLLTDTLLRSALEAYESTRGTLEAKLAAMRRTLEPEALQGAAPSVCTADERTVLDALIAGTVVLSNSGEVQGVIRLLQRKLDAAEATIAQLTEERDAVKDAWKRETPPITRLDYQNVCDAVVWEHRRAEALESGYLHLLHCEDCQSSQMGNCEASRVILRDMLATSDGEKKGIDILTAELMEARKQRDLAEARATAAETLVVELRRAMGRMREPVEDAD